MRDASRLITKNLYFDMAGCRHEALNIYLVIAKSRARFRLATGVRLLDVVETANNAHPAAASPGDGFNDDRGVRGFGLQKGFDLSKAGWPCRTSQHGHATLASQ